MYLYDDDGKLYSCNATEMTKHVAAMHGMCILSAATCLGSYVGLSVKKMMIVYNLYPMLLLFILFIRIRCLSLSNIRWALKKVWAFKKAGV